jgi:hypothetical protein
MSNLSERLRALAETLDGCEWNHPLCSASHCRKAADAIERLQAKLEKSAREESTALTQVEKYSIENGRLVAENKRLIGHLAEPAEVRAAAMECSLRVVEHELDQTRAKLADALRLSPAEFQRLRKEKDAEIEQLQSELKHEKEWFDQRTKEAADACKAAESLYTSLLAGEGIISREEIIRSALERWPWLGPAEPKMATHSSEATK